ncbi:MAG: DUF362 domain-containing protein [Candidatus Latescibacterota bacterium]|jgi:uncharacterized protein (DUF362 family)
MRVKADRVYLYRTAIDDDVAPFGRYEELAHDALSRLDLDLPGTGTLAFKPNITIPAEPDTRIVTHPGFVVGLLRRLLELGVSRERLVVMEAWGTPHTDAGRQHHHANHHRHHANFPEHGNWRPHGHLPEVSGYDAALAALGLSLTNHDLSEGVEVPLPDGVVFRHLRLTHHAAQAGFLFNVPVAKCHNLSCTTLTTKNLQGLALSPQRHMCTIQAEDEGVKAEELTRITDSGLSLHEERFCHKHADLVTAVRRTGVPRLCVVDGLIGRDGTAFNEGRNHPLGWVLIGDNEVHVDAVGTYLFGLDPEKTPYLRVAAARGLGTNRVAEIEVIDLSSGRSLDAKALAGHRHAPPLMPVARYENGYYPRFREDGSVVPWALDRVNEQRRADGLEPIPAR